MAIGMLAVGVLAALAVEFLPPLKKVIPKPVDKGFEIIGFIIVALAVVDALGGGQVFGLINFLSGVPVLGGLIAGLALGFAGASVAKAITK